MNSRLAAAPSLPVEAAPVRSGRPQDIPRPPEAQIGAAAPWARLHPERRRFDLGVLESRLASSSSQPPAPDERQRLSAVLIPLYEHEGETFVILTRRSVFVRAHRREVSFPGGAKEFGDADLWSTALREAHEEIGLSPASPRLIGWLEPRFTVSSNSLFHPFVAILPERPARLQPDPAEVEAILHVSASELLAPETFREELWPAPEGGPPRSISFFELEHDTVWGATATLLRRLLELGIPEVDSPIDLPLPAAQPPMGAQAEPHTGETRRLRRIGSAADRPENEVR